MSSVIKLSCKVLYVVVLLTVWSALETEAQFPTWLQRQRFNPWGPLIGQRPRGPVPIPKVLTCFDVICPDPSTRCMDAGGAEPARCIDPCKGSLLRRGCPRIYMPICATDGVVYSNTCYMEAAMCADRTLDVCVITSGKCQDLNCATTGRTGMASSSEEDEEMDANYARDSYYDALAKNERRVEASYTLRGN